MALEFKSDVINAEQARAAIESVAVTLTDPGTWSKGALARDKDGGRVSVDSPEAESFCLVGAIIRNVYVKNVLNISNTANRSVATRDVEKYFDSVLGVKAAEFNDSPVFEQSDVLLMIKTTLRDFN